MTVHDSTLSTNRAVHGGALWSDSGDVLLQDSTIADNRALASSGGVYSTFDLVLTLRNCVVSGNTAVNTSGGGLGAISPGGFAGNGGLFVQNCEFVDNSARSGAALIVSNDGGNPTLEVSNSTFSGNVATNRGGALSIGLPATIRNCTLTGNTAGIEGGGIANFDLLTIRDSIVVDNSAPVGGDLFLGPSGTVDLINSTVGDIAP